MSYLASCELCGWDQDPHMGELQRHPHHHFFVLLRAGSNVKPPLIL